MIFEGAIEGTLNDIPQAEKAGVKRIVFTQGDV
jgi:hypothetical protein